MEIITVFTPTYNRKEKLVYLYESLEKQTCKDFVWLIVDDGSADGTGEYIKSVSDSASFKVEYCYQENAGKSMAHNKGVELTQTELFTCVDSDDLITSDCVERILSTWREKQEEDIGILAFCSQSKLENAVSGIRTTLKNAYDNLGLRGDTMLVYKTEIIKTVAFPHFEGEKFVPENYLYDVLDQKGKLILLPEVLYIREYCEDGYTKNINTLIRNNPRGYEAYISQRIKTDKGLKSVFYDTVRHISILLVMKKKVMPFLKHKMLGIMAYPFGYMLYLKRFR